MRPDQNDILSEFESAVLSNFSFLIDTHGFRYHEQRISEIILFITYDNSDVYVTLSYYTLEHEPSLSFGRRGIDDVPGAYSFVSDDLIALDCCRSWTWIQSHDDRLGSWVADLARLLATCGLQCLAGDPSVFVEMQTRRDARLAHWVHEEETKKIRRQAEIAWKSKDYNLVIRLYASIDKLSMLEMKRLDYARKHL